LIVTLCFLGSYAERNAIFDVGLMVVFGLVALLSGRAKYPVVSMLLGILLGPLVEVNFYRSLRVGLGSYAIFITRPITLVLLLITLAFMAWPFVSPIFRRKKREETPPSGDEETLESTADSVWIEFALLIGVLFFFGLIQWKSWQYSRDTAMFPEMISILGLGLGVYHLLILLPKVSSRRGEKAQCDIPRSCVPPWLSFMGFGVYVVLFYLIGLPAATVLYIAGAAFLAGYRRKKVLIPLSIGTGVCLYLFAWAMRIPLPVWGLLSPSD